MPWHPRQVQPRSCPTVSLGPDATQEVTSISSYYFGLLLHGANTLFAPVFGDEVLRHHMDGMYVTSASKMVVSVLRDK